MAVWLSMKRRVLVAIALLAGILLNAVTGWAQVVNPADAQKELHHSWQLPPLTVEGKRMSELREEELVGTYAQPRWTTTRRFGETRVYVIPEGQFEFEYWLVPEFTRGGDTDVETKYEFEMGLGHHLQLDLYLISHEEEDTGSMDFDEQKFEVRWALADWGKIPANPTIYLEWAAINDAPDHIESKLLLGGEFAPRWHWGANLVFEHEMGGPQEDSKEITAGISYTVLDERFSVGLETKLAFITDNEDTDETEILVGPSLQYRPLPPIHINLALLAGLNNDSPHAKGVLVVGYEF